MANATAEVNTAEIIGRTVELVAGEGIYAGTLVAVKPADGRAYPASDAATLVVLGRAENTAKAGESVLVAAGTFLWENSASSPLTYPGQAAYVADDHTVKAAAGTNSVKAGVCRGIIDGKAAVATL